MLKEPSGLAETDAREGLRQVRLTEVGVEQAGLPVRSPGAHLHPLLRRPPVAGGCGAG